MMPSQPNFHQLESENSPFELDASAQAAEFVSVIDRIRQVIGILVDTSDLDRVLDRYLDGVATRPQRTNLVGSYIRE